MTNYLLLTVFSMTILAQSIAFRFIGKLAFNIKQQRISSLYSTANSDPQLIQNFQKHQSSARKLTIAEEIRTLIQQSTGYGVLSTNSVQFPGFPTGSVVGFQVGDEGKPFFVFSSMSAHTKDIVADGRASLTVTAKNFKDAADARIVLIGTVSKVSPEKKQAYREEYLKKHKDAYWIDFGDFDYFTLGNIDQVRYVGGFAKAGSISGTEYTSSAVDPLAAFADHVINHMNQDHADSTVAMIKHYVGVDVSSPQIISLDRFGMTIEAKFDFSDGEISKMRLPFPREVVERKAVKEIIVEMTKAAAVSESKESKNA